MPASFAGGKRGWLKEKRRSEAGAGMPVSSSTAPEARVNLRLGVLCSVRAAWAVYSTASCDCVPRMSLDTWIFGLCLVVSVTRKPTSAA